MVISATPDPSLSSCWKYPVEPQIIKWQPSIIEPPNETGYIKSHSLNMASSLTKQQMKLSKSIISLSAYRATRIWFSLLLSLKPTNRDNDCSKKVRNQKHWVQLVIKSATCSLHSQAHLIRAHGPWLVKIKLSKNDLRNREEKCY